MRVHGDAAVVRYRATPEVVFDGIAIPREQYWRTDTYERTDGRWQVVRSRADAIRWAAARAPGRRAPPRPGAPRERRPWCGAGGRGGC